MTQVENIESIIEKLTEDEFKELRQWFMDKEWHKWNKQIEKDSEEGKLDFLIKEALEEKNQGKLKAF